MSYFNHVLVVKQLEDVFNRVQKMKPGKEKTDANWLCTNLKLSIEESGRAIRENDRLQKEIKALRAKVNGK